MLNFQIVYVDDLNEDMNMTKPCDQWVGTREKKQLSDLCEKITSM